VTRLNLQAQRDVPVAVVVVLLEDVGHALEADAGLYVATPVIGGVQQLDELRREAVAKGDEGVGELVVRDAARVVGVEAVEEVAPGREEAPEAAGGVSVSLARPNPPACRKALLTRTPQS
jgi:hypothetical protein